MDYYDYEREPNYPEVEEIIENATDEFSKFLHETFVDEYKGIKTSKDLNAINAKELDERKKALDKREYELEKREVEIAKIEEEQYEKAKVKWFAKLGLNFDIGDTAYYLKDVTERVTCPTCNGKHRVVAKIENADNTFTECEVTCPNCNYGWIKGKKEYEIIEAKVEKIKATIRKTQQGSVDMERTNWSGNEFATCVWVRNKKDRESIEIIGEKLYKTKEEAEKLIEEELKKG